MPRGIRKRAARSGRRRSEYRAALLFNVERYSKTCGSFWKTPERIPRGIAFQCRAVFENLRLVLEDAGANWNDMVDVTVFLTNMKKDFPVYNKLYAEYFAGEGKPNPTRTTIEVTALPTPIAIELKVIAAL